MDFLRRDTPGKAPFSPRHQLEATAVQQVDSKSITSNSCKMVTIMASPRLLICQVPINKTISSILVTEVTRSQRMVAMVGTTKTGTRRQMPKTIGLTGLSSNDKEHDADTETDQISIQEA